MRDLTDEELSKCPNDCDHYIIINDAVYFTNVLGVGVYGIDGNEIDDSLLDGIFMRSKRINKPFDITQHEWGSGDFIDVFKAHTDDTHLHFFIAPYCHGKTWINKSDAIAIAKHFKLKAEDLS